MSPPGHSFADFYRHRLKRYAVVRVPKEALWFALWYTRWQIIRPAARAVIPHRFLRVYHLLRSVRWSRLAKACAMPPLPMASYSEAARQVAGEARQIFPAATVRQEPTAVVPARHAGLLASLPQCWDVPAVTVRQWRAAEVVAKSNMIVVGGRVLHHDLYRFERDYTSEELHGRLRILPRKAARRLESLVEGARFDRAAAFTDACSANYAHWLTEVLPRLHAYVRSGLPEGATVILDADLHANMLASAELVTGGRARLHRLEAGAVARVERLDVVSPAGYIPFDRRGKAQPGDSHGVFSPPAFASLRAQLAGALGAPPASTPRNVLIRRKSGYRSLVNEQELEDRLVAEGFVPVYPERLSFAEQFHLFSNADTVVGATGAAMANLIFSRPGAHVVICLSALPYHIYGYWRNMAQAVGCRLTYVLGPVVGAQAAGIHADFSVDVNDVLAAAGSVAPNDSKEMQWHSATAA
jgi:capsular polysaccharide biosynthesis protein